MHVLQFRFSAVQDSTCISVCRVIVIPTRTYSTGSSLLLWPKIALLILTPLPCIQHQLTYLSSWGLLLWSWHSQSRDNESQGTGGFWKFSFPWGRAGEWTSSGCQLSRGSHGVGIAKEMAYTPTPSLKASERAMACCCPAGMEKKSQCVHIMWAVQTQRNRKPTIHMTAQQGGMAQYVCGSGLGWVCPAQVGGCVLELLWATETRSNCLLPIHATA